MTNLEYDYDPETDEEIIHGASIDLPTLHKEIGYIPNPMGLRDNPSPQMDIWIALQKHLKEKDFRIPHILKWIGTDLGFYNDYEEFESIVENDEPDVEFEECLFFVYWKTE